MGKLIIRLAVILGFLLRWNKGSRLIFSEIPGYTKNDTLILLFILFPEYEAPPLQMERGCFNNCLACFECIYSQEVKSFEPITQSREATRYNLPIPDSYQLPGILVVGAAVKVTEEFYLAEIAISQEVDYLRSRVKPVSNFSFYPFVTF
jgi:hypothetical protein